MVDLSKFTFNKKILSMVVACNQFWVKLCPLKKKILMACLDGGGKEGE